MTARSAPDPFTRWLAHTLVALALGSVVGKQTGLAGGLAAAAAAVVAHEALDAPVADMLAAGGL